MTKRGFVFTISKTHDSKNHTLETNFLDEAVSVGHSAQTHSLNNHANLRLPSRNDTLTIPALHFDGSTNNVLICKLCLEDPMAAFARIRIPATRHR